MTVFDPNSKKFNSFSAEAPLPTTNGPPQPRGLFSCRMSNCTENVPICRMLNHIRTFHIASLTEVSESVSGKSHCDLLTLIRFVSFYSQFRFQHRLQDNDDEFIMHYTFKCQNFRQCIRIAQFGLFFLIVNVNRDGNQTIITSWVQCVGRNTECKLFTFNLQMRIANAIAHFTDYVSFTAFQMLQIVLSLFLSLYRFFTCFLHVSLIHVKKKQFKPFCQHHKFFVHFQTYGETSDASYIQQKKQCLFYETNVTAKRIKDIAVDVKISKATGERTGRRRTTTTVVPINRN